jgi:hypothetical protein
MIFQNPNLSYENWHVDCSVYEIWVSVSKNLGPSKAGIHHTDEKRDMVSPRLQGSEFMYLEIFAFLTGGT